MTANVPPPGQPPRRRPVYYPAGYGCLLWLFVLILVWFAIGLWWAPAYYPWGPWWRWR